jgi:hypothetical protein
MGFFSSIGHAFKSIGNKIGQGVKYIGQKAEQGLDYGIQGLKTATDFADKYTFGLDHFIPYYSMIKAGIDISDHIRKMAKGEEKLSWSSALDMGLDTASGLMSAYGGKQELEGLKGGYKMFKGARATGSGMKEALKIGGGRVLRGYGVHKEQLKEMGREGFRGGVNIAKAMRRGEPTAFLKVGAGASALAGAGVVYDKSKQEEQQQQIPQKRPQPRVLNPNSQNPPKPKQAPSIVPPRPTSINGHPVLTM